MTIKNRFISFYNYIKTVSSNIDNCGTVGTFLYKQNCINIFFQMYLLHCDYT